MDNQRTLLEECLHYFKSQSGYGRILEALVKKWQEYGHAAGKITITAPTEEEREALQGFLGESQEGTKLVFSMKAFEAALAESRFSEITLELLLGAWLGAPLKTNKSLRTEKSDAKVQFYEELMTLVSGDAPESQQIGKWITAMFTDKKYGYRTLMPIWEENPQKAMRTLRSVVQAAQQVLRYPDKRHRLAVLSAQASGNPHTLDKGRPAGNLLLQLLAFMAELPKPEDGESTLEMYTTFGIYADELSNFSLMRGIHLLTAEEEHPAFQAFAKRGEVCAVTLGNLEGITKAKAEAGSLWIVENQMVFSWLNERLPQKNVALLCSSGQINMASLVIIDLLCAAGTRLHYASDLDPEGLGIADRLMKRHPQWITPWRMAPEDYAEALKKTKVKEVLTPQRLKKLSKIDAPALRETAACLKDKKYAAYQEMLLEVMLEDIRRG